jgi:YVTN family beta-propeller protein
MKTCIRLRHILCLARHRRRPCVQLLALMLPPLLCLASVPLAAQEKSGAAAVSQTASQKKAAIPSTSATKQPTTQKITREGVTVEFDVEPVGTPDKAALLEGGAANIIFRIRDTTTGGPMTGLRPAAWLDLREQAGATDEKTCRSKVQSFLQGGLSARPDVDLNQYYILALNQEPNISVINPLLGVGPTKLLTLVLLKSPGADWVMSGDQRWLYVSMPLVNQVAVVDTELWKVVANVETGAQPKRLRLQRDGRYLWVGADGMNPADRSGVTIIDTATRTVAAQISTGMGHHDIALSSDDSYAFVTNQQDGTLTVIDIARLARVKDLKTGDSPVAVAFSQQSRMAYVVHEVDGTIVSVDGLRQETGARIKVRPGLVALQFTPDGRYGFAVNRKESTAHIFDAATNLLLHTVPVGPSPDQVSFTKQFAYVRSLGSEQVTMIRLAEIGRASVEQSTGRFPGGQQAPQLARNETAIAPAVVNAPEEGSVLVANPADQVIYYYTEGMAAPMGNFRNYSRQPRAVLVRDASLREAAPGVYRTRAKLAGRGSYDVAFLLDSPRFFNCFVMAVAENPEIKRNQVAIRVEPMLKGQVLPLGKEVRLRFKVADSVTGRPMSDLKDMGVLMFLTPGIWQKRDWARHVGEGVYEVSVTPPHEGVYYVFFQCPSLRVRYNQLPHLILSVRRDAPMPDESQKSSGTARH